MTQTLGSHYWQEQAQRANEIRPILEQAFALAQEYGWVAPLADDCWQYQGEAHTLVYDPNAAALWVEANTDTWRINFHEQVFVPEADTHITEEQLQDCRKLRDHLAQTPVPDTIDLRAIQQAAQEQWQQVEQTPLAATVAQLFEYYAAQGEAASQLSNTAYAYEVAVADVVYRLSRDDATGTYNVKRAGTALDFATGQGITQHDVQIWSDIDSWLIERQRLAAEAPPAENPWEETYWSQQKDRANAILPIAAQALCYQEAQGAVQRHPDGTVSSTAGDYDISYHPKTDTLSICREDTIIVTAADSLQHHDAATGRWQSAGLSHLGAISQTDLEAFRSLQAWLQVKEPQAESAAGLMASTNTRSAVTPFLELPSPERQSQLTAEGWATLEQSQQQETEPCFMDVADLEQGAEHEERG